MSVPMTLAARWADEPASKPLAERLPRAKGVPECLQLLRVPGGQEFSCTRPEGHGGLCAAHGVDGEVVAVSRWARRR
jgi:hypothetical protein